MHTCIFCAIVAEQAEASIVYRDDQCTAFLDINPVNPGDVLLVPNEHAAFLSELDPDTGAHMFRVAQQLAHVLRRSGVRCEGVNFMLADGEAAGQEVFHVHLHVFPRYRGDGFGLHFGDTFCIKPTRAELGIVAQQIRDAW